MPIIPELAKTWHLYALDLRGHGKSDRADGYRLYDYVPDIASVLNNLIQKPAVLFGHSLGGMISLIAAARHPELIEALIIGDSMLSLKFIKEFSAQEKEKLIWWRELARTGDVEYITSQLKQELIQHRKTGELVPAYQIFGENHPSFRAAAECYSQTDPEVLTANLENIEETFAEYKIDQLLPQIKCPVLIIQANPRLGGLLRDEDIDKALNLLPNAQHIRIDHVGHFLHLQDKEAVLEAITPFLNSLA
ncbi:MAG: alpha/beta hydrolase [Thermincola sp.]|jgi:pimeloyl-ACP methyl ester carboxylesterase|nr:alpha/beta hydrolase [Thermincola sp.]MDT3701966.1 alpha/beta hydrolase [Thermincola sp.]